MSFISELKEKMAEAGNDINIDINKGSNQIVKLQPETISNWEHRDRQIFEVGDLDELARSIKVNGQAQPIVVVEQDSIFRSKDENGAQYVVIAGYRRWLACKKHELPVEAIIKKLQFPQAISCLISENERESVSDYSKGMFFKDILEKEKITKTELFERLGYKRATFSNYLSFADVPKEIWAAVDDLQKVSARTASEIRLIAMKGSDYVAALILLGNKISNGVGANVLKRLVDDIVNVKQKTAAPIKKSINNKFILEFSDKQIKIKTKDIESDKHEILISKIESILSDDIFK